MRPCAHCGRLGKLMFFTDPSAPAVVIEVCWDCMAGVLNDEKDQRSGGRRR